MSILSKYPSGVTQHDIAKMLSLSRSTVAYALNPKHRHKLQPETLKLVLDKVEECGYRPKKAATILGTGRSHVIGVVYQYGIYHAPMERVRFLAHHAIEAGYQLVAVDRDWFNDDITAIRNHLIDAAVEGVIFCNLYSVIHPLGELFTALNIPQIAISCHSAPSNIEHISSNMECAFYNMTRHHLEQGSRRLNLLLPFHGHDHRVPGSMITQRFEGFQRAILEAGGRIELSEENHRFFTPKSTSNTGTDIVGVVSYPVRTRKHVDAFALGFHYIEELLTQKIFPESLICSNDEIAAGAVTSCIKHGVSVPGKLRISGADNAPFSAYSGVPITTIRQPTQEMMGNAVERLIASIKNHGQSMTANSGSLFPCELIIRDSTVKNVSF